MQFVFRVLKNFPGVLSTIGGQQNSRGAVARSVATTWVEVVVIGGYFA